MRKFYGEGKSTPWLSENLTEKELSRLTIGELLIICRHIKHKNNSFKKYLINYILSCSNI